MADIIGSVGLMLDIAGAFWLARGLMTLPEHIVAEASDKGAVYGDDSGAVPVSPALSKWYRQGRRDARIGTSLLILGFTGQFFALWM